MTHKDFLHKDFLKWFQQRPWLLMPVLAVIPLTGAYLHQHYPQPAAAPTPSESPVISQAVSAPSPLPPPPAIATQPTAKATKSPQPAQSPLVPVDPSQYTPEQKAINEKAKAAFAPGSVDSAIEMHVAIAMGTSSSEVGSSNGATVRDQNGRSLQQLAPGNAYTVRANGDTLIVGDWQLPSMVMVQAKSGALYLGDKPYRGKFLLAAQGGRIWVVNHIDLRQYLYSVVASEVSPSWNVQALKAQAVAARSYALTYYFRPVNGLYHMGADEYYQVYSGIEKEDERTNRAVDATAGEFVSYKGGIVESLYAASDAIVAEAFRGKGMSQLGALKLADQGYNYLQILATYYPKTGVSKIEYDQQ